MTYVFLADAILLLHAAFVIFAMFGGLLTLRYPKVLWLHLPVLLWAAAVEWANWICPLTPLENYFRLRGGQAGFEGGFLDHWIAKVLYPPSLTLELRYALALGLIAMNVAVYAWVLARCGNTKSG